jgi:hypothetical protein
MKDSVVDGPLLRFVGKSQLDGRLVLPAHEGSLLLIVGQQSKWRKV